MNILAFIYRYGIWIAVPTFVLAAGLLIFFIITVIRVVKQAHLVSVPLLKQQEIQFVEAGRVVLAIEGPLLTTRFARLDYTLIGPLGTEVHGRSSLFRARTSSFSKVRMELKVYELPCPGRYIFQIHGLPEGGPGDDRHRIVFMRPHLRQSIACVVGIVFSSGLLIGSLVLFLMRLLGVGVQH